MDKAAEEYIRIGRMLVASEPGDEVVITGISARLPESDNIQQFQENLDNVNYLVTNDDRRWVRSYEDTPYSMGKVSHNNKVDAGFFDMSYRQADFMDPQCRQLTERAVEAVLDSGYSLAELQKTKTGVWVGHTLSDSEKILLYDKLESPHFGLEGTNHSMFAQQISYHLKLNGPSANVDTACSSSLYGFDHAYRAIKLGLYDNAIIAGSHIILNPILNQFFYKLGIVSLEGDTLVFDGNGYIRSEAIAVVFIQRAKDARRVYAEVKHVKTNVDGFKEEGVTFPSQYMISNLMSDTFAEAQIDPESLDVIEAHATGTKIGDPQELYAITQVLCKNRKVPLLLGSVKSTIGHSEPVSGLCSLIKLALGMNNDQIYANCNYYGHDELELTMMKKNLKIVTKTLDYPKDGSNLACINSYGFGGANSFLVIKRWMKEKKNFGLPVDDLPRLVCFSGRNEKCLQPILRDLSTKKFDAEYIRMWHAIYSYGMRNHPARGYIILTKNGEIQRSSASFPTTPLCLAFDKFSYNWVDVLQQLGKIDLFKRNTERVHKIFGVTSLINDVKSDMIGNVIIHAVMTNTFKDIGVEYEYVTGSSFGVLSAAFADGTLTFEQLISSAQAVDLYLNFTSGVTTKGKDNLETSKQKLISALQKIISKPKPFSNKWILQSNDDNRMSAEYIVDQLFSSNSNAHKKLRDVAFIIFGQTKFEPETKVINILAPLNGHNVIESFMSGLGCIYQLGQNLKLHKLYPEVQFPVSRKTPLISPAIDWDHDEDYYVFRYTNTPPDCVQTFDFSLKAQDPDWMYLNGHVLDDQRITPMTSYLYMVWDTFSRMTGIMKVKMPVTFENVEMHRVINMMDQQHKKFVVRILKQTNKFEIEELGEIVFSGYITLGVDKMAQPPRVVREGVVLSEDDVYKLLQLRGYHYSDQFRSIKKYDIGKRKGTVEWNNNWATFIDSMMQLTVLYNNEATLELPVGFKKLAIDPIFFLSNTDSMKDVFLYKNIARSDGIELLSLSTKTIKRQKTSCRTVMETIKFVPYTAKLSLNEAVQVNTQLVVENIPSTKLKVAEIVDEKSARSLPCLTSIAKEVFQNTIGIQTEYFVSCKVPLQVEGIQVVEQSPPKDQTHDLVIMSNVLRQKRFNEAFQIIKKNGFIISREDMSLDLSKLDSDVLSTISVVTNYTCEQERLVLLKRTVEYTAPAVIKMSQNFSWVPQLQDALGINQKVVVFSENEPTSGVIGLVNTLKLEHNRTTNIKCVFIPENTAQLQLHDKIVSEQLKKDLCINVLKGGVWGSYRGLILGPQVTKNTRGVILGNNFEWFASADNFGVDLEKTKIMVHYASVLPKVKSPLTAEDESPLSMIEFSGVDESGKRVMGYVNKELLSTTVEADRSLVWDVPNDWALEDAVTVPDAYISAIYMLMVKANLKKGTNILLHCLPVSTTEAIVNIAKSHGCQVFITDRNREKLSMLINQYKNATNAYVGTFDSVFFRKEIHKRGGAQIIINASVNKNLYSLSNCLTPNGTFLQMNNRKSKMYLDTFSTARYIAVDIVSALEQIPIKNQLRTLFQNGLNTKMIRPIYANWIERKDIAETLQQSPEKVVVKMRDGEEKLFPSTSRFYCNPNQVYVIVGGLGGFGLELLDWLIGRGAQFITVCSRSNKLNGYQQYKINLYKSKGVNINISTSDVTSEKGCFELLKSAGEVAPVGAIFNLAAATNDDLFENHTIDTFAVPFPGKAFATEYLDRISRELCPNLQYFVVFSSFTSSRGNIGQSNYTMANSVMERICERRRVDGYHALAVQPGAIADVGLVTKMANYNINKIIGGTVQQNLQSCFELLDRCLMQDETVVLFMNLANASASKSLNYEEGIQRIIGITNLNTVSHHVSLPELGMDSVTSIEVQSYLENSHGLSLDISEIRNLTLAKLRNLMNPNATV